MSDIVLKPASWKLQIAISLVVIAATLLAVNLLTEGTLNDKPMVGLCVMTAVFAGGYAYLASGRYLRFSESGFEIKERFSSGKFIPFSEVEDIGVACFPSSAGGKYTYSMWAGIKLHESTTLAMTDGCRNNRSACGYDILLTPYFGLPLDRFVTLLKQKMHESKQIRQ